jgi:hypothetical protein
MEGRDDDYSYVKTMERDDVNKRLKMLFKPDEQEPTSSHSQDSSAKQDDSDTLKEAYETVNEGETTDTTSGVEDETLLQRTKPK